MSAFLVSRVLPNFIDKIWNQMINKTCKQISSIQKIL